MWNKYTATIFLLCWTNIVLGQLEQNLLIHYSFQGNFADASQNGFEGFPTNINFGSDQQGNLNAAAEFNGTNSYIDFPNVPELKPDFPITMVAVVKFDEFANQIVAATDFSSSTHSGAWLQTSGSGQLAVCYGNGQGGFTMSTTHRAVADFQVELDTWYVVAGVWRGFNDLDLYIDCEKQDVIYASNATTIGYTSNGGNLGRKYSSTLSSGQPLYLNGFLQEFWYWDRELSETEISSFSACSTPTCPASLTIPSSSACSGQEVEYSFLLENSSSGIASIQWEFGNGSSSQDDAPSVIYASGGDYPYTLAVTTADNCVYEASGSTVVVTATDPPDIQTQVTLCQGESFSLVAADYPEWTITDSEGDEVIVFTTENAGTYSFTFLSACSLEQIDISIDQIVISDYIDFEDQSICTDSDIVIDIPNWESVASESDIQITLEANAPVTYAGVPIAFNFSEEGLYSLEVEGFISNCPLYEEFQIEVVSPPESFVQNDFNICDGDLIDFDFSELPFTVRDSDGEEILSVQISSSGTFIFTGQNACSTFEETVTVNETDIDPPSFGAFQFLCQGLDTVTIGFDSDDYDYLWESGSQDQSILVIEPGQYEVLVSDTTGVCSEFFTFQVNNFPFSPSEIFDFPAIEICLEGQTTFNFPPQYGPYTFSDSLVGFTYTATDSETLGFTYSDQCYTYRDSLVISVESCLCPAWVPNAFTPDEDGLNDLFQPIVECEVYDYRMLIFNRWGNEIFESKDVNLPWRGESLNPNFYSRTGVYVYRIVFTQELDGLRVPVELNGTITLLR